jgi:polyisoprenoid-binding protein YceI
VERVDDTHYKVHGDLTIRDVTKQVVLDAEFEGEVDDPWGHRRAAFTATTQISRNEFGVKWNQLIEAGGAVVSDNVKITLHVEAVRQS